MIRHRYADYGQHPAPFVRLSIRCTETQRQVDDVPAQLDSGSDRTVIPAQVVTTLELSQMGSMQVCGLQGQISELPTYIVEVLIHDLTGVRAKMLAGDNEPFVLLGRDVLNHFRVVLDGPAKALEIS
jgi:hypothetical protein